MCAVVPPTGPHFTPQRCRSCRAHTPLGGQVGPIRGDSRSRRTARPRRRTAQPPPASRAGSRARPIGAAINTAAPRGLGLWRTVCLLPAPRPSAGVRRFPIKQGVHVDGACALFAAPCGILEALLGPSASSVTMFGSASSTPRRRRRAGAMICGSALMSGRSIGPLRALCIDLFGEPDHFRDVIGGVFWRSLAGARGPSFFCDVSLLTPRSAPVHHLAHSLPHASPALRRMSSTMEIHGLAPMTQMSSFL